MTTAACAWCGEQYARRNAAHVVCSAECSVALFRAGNDAAAERRRQYDLAMTAFCKFIRLRDEGRPCCSCGSENASVAGHFFEKKKYPALAFTEANCHAQCVKCNRYESGNLVEYLDFMVGKYGSDGVELMMMVRSIESRYSIAALIKIKEEYQKKCREIKKKKKATHAKM